MNEQTVGQRIAALRAAQGLTQAQLGEQLGVSGKAVSKWEVGKCYPDITICPKLARLLHTTVDELLRDPEPAAENHPSLRDGHGGMQSLRSLYRIGVGPSSSHTMGPDRICRIFRGRHPDAARFSVILYGSLASTGRGHGTDRVIRAVFADRSLDLQLNPDANLPFPNTMDLTAVYPDRTVTARAYSLGGGAIAFDGEAADEPDVYPHRSFYEIAQSVRAQGIRLYDYVRACEGDAIFDYLRTVWAQMQQTIRDGLNAEGVLPGGLGVERKAKFLHRSHYIGETADIQANRLIAAYAYACSEQNAAGGTVVTAPTCGSCGVLPAVLRYMQDKHGFSDAQICNALATGGIVGNLIKHNASISGAECGCQAEIGSACAMAAAALAELFELNIEQIEYAAEISIEHHLGLTCDPVNGLVQIPCIERNAVAAMRAINALSLSNFLTYTRKVSLDTIIETMYQTGRDLACGYRETSRNGLAQFYVKNDPKRSV